MKPVKLVEKFMHTDNKRWDSLKGYVLSLVFMSRAVFTGNFWADFIALVPEKRTECPVLDSCVGIQSDKLQPNKFSEQAEWLHVGYRSWLCKVIQQVCNSWIGYVLHIPVIALKQLRCHVGVFKSVFLWFKLSVGMLSCLFPQTLPILPLYMWPFYFHFLASCRTRRIWCCL